MKRERRFLKRTIALLACAMVFASSVPVSQNWISFAENVGNTNNGETDGEPNSSDSSTADTTETTTETTTAETTAETTTETTTIEIISDLEANDVFKEVCDWDEGSGSYVQSDAYAQKKYIHCCGENIQSIWICKVSEGFSFEINPETVDENTDGVEEIRSVGVDSSENNYYIEISENGNYYLAAYFDNGTYSGVENYAINSIDTIAPEISISYVHKIIKTGCKTDCTEYTIVVKVSDNASSVDSSSLSLYSGESLLEGVEVEDIGNGEYKITYSSSGDLMPDSLKATDEAGNDESASLTEGDVNNFLTAEVMVETTTKGEYGYSSEMTINLTFDPSDAIASVKCGDDEVVANDDNLYTYSVTDAETDECQFTCECKDEDAYGDSFVISVFVNTDNFDNTNPEIELVVDEATYTSYEADWSQEIKITGQINDKNPESVYYYRSDESLDDDTINGLSNSLNGTSKDYDVEDDFTCVEVEDNGSFTIDDNNIDDGEYYYYIWAVDKAGNISENYCVYHAKLDTTIPSFGTCEFTGDSRDASELNFIEKITGVLTYYLYTNVLEMNISASDELSGIAKLEYSLTGPDADDYEEIEDAVEQLQADEENEGVEIEISLSASEEKDYIGYVYLKVTDYAGNAIVLCMNEDEGEAVIWSNVASTAPNVQYDYPETWTNQYAEIIISGGNNSVAGLDYYQYQTSDDDKWKKIEIELNDDGELEFPIPEDDSGIVNTVYSFRAVSNTGVESDATSVTVKIDTTTPVNPTISTSKVNGDDGWYVTAPDVSLTNPEYEEGGQAPITTVYSIKGDNGVSESGNITENGEKVDLSDYFKQDGTYTLTYYAINDAGTKGDEVTVEIKVDTTAPVKSELYIADASVSGGKQDITAQEKTSIIYRYIYQDAITIYTSFDCEVSGLSKIQYQLVSSFAVDATAWETYDSSKGIVVEPNEKFILAVRATDKAGNQTIVYSDGIIVDSEAPVGEQYAPELTITPAAANANGFYNNDVSVYIAAIDPAYSDLELDASNGIYSGLQEITYQVLADGVVTQSGTLYSASDEPTNSDLLSSWNGSIVIDSALNNTNNVIVEVTATDRAGNVRVSRTADGEIQIDITDPVIRISYDNNSPDSTNTTYFKESRTATIEVVERNFSADDVNLSITNTDGSIPSISGWSVSGTGDATVYTATLTYSADGDYTFDIAFTDLAGNICTEINYVSGSAAPTEFTIDQTIPTIAVSYDNNSVTNSKYFAKARTATVVINEHNFDSSRVEITATASKDGKSITIPSSNISWSSSGDNHTATIEYTEDGDYTFDIAFVDMAGNESGAADYGSSAAGKDFIIDTAIEAPTVKINGKDGNGMAFQDDISISIRFGDINYDSYEVVLLRTRMGEKNVDVTEEFIDALTVSDNSAEGTFDAFDKVQENDGIYTLTVSLMDKAGNSETTTVKFTINRFGSVYEYSDYLISLIADDGAYVQALDDDLVITEYNADKLVEGSLSIVITKDGKPLEDVSYEYTPEINEEATTGSSGWYQYSYTISKENFASDGIYKMVISSEDEAGNLPESTSYDNILFYVDSTAPELTSVTGLEERIINAQELSVGYNVYDTIGLKSVKIYVDDEEVGEVTDFAGDLNNYDGSFSIGESKNAQSVRLVVEDLAGNITDTDADDFSSAYTFEKSILISTNAFVRFFANKPLFFGTVGGVCVILIGVGFLIFWKKKKKEAKTA